MPGLYLPRSVRVVTRRVEPHAKPGVYAETNRQGRRVAITTGDGVTASSREVSMQDLGPATQERPIVVPGLGLMHREEMAELVERIKERPANRERLMRMDPERFIEVMSRWSEQFMQGAEQPIIGASEQDLKSIRAPACVVPGNDNRHPLHTAETLSRYLRRGELHQVVTKRYDVDFAPRDDWNEKEGELASLFVEFMKRVKSPVTT